MRLLPILFLVLSFFAQAQKKAVFNAADLKLDWKLITNNYQGKDQYQFSITLTNNNKKSVLPPGNWTIYYNANRDVSDSNLTGPMKSYRIHGDLFYLKPTADFKGLNPGESITVLGVGDAWAFNISDAPSGFYLVWDKEPNKTYAITKTTATPPADINKFKRSPNQVNDQVTPEMVFEQNATIKDLPSQEIQVVFTTPVSYQAKDGKFILNAATAIQADPAFSNEAALLKEELESFTTFKFNSNQIFL